MAIPKEVVTSLIGACTALTPLVINYFGKKSKDNARKNLLDDSQSQINFINNYFDSLKRLLPDAELETLKNKLAAELFEIKSKINETNEKHINAKSGAHFTFQKIFLTFKPLTFTGWIWAILFYLDLFTLFMFILGAAIDNNGEFSGTQLYQTIFVKDGLSAIIITIVALLLFRWLAIRNYKRNLIHSNTIVTVPAA
jgi:hypothetical protein